jgi:hypothetical protein
LGYAVFVFSLAMVLAASAARMLRRPVGWAHVVGLVVAAVVLVGYARRTHHDVSAWDRAGDIQRQEIHALRAIGKAPDGTTIYTFGGIAQALRAYSHSGLHGT